MSKTAREVMIPGRVWPGDELGDRATLPSSGGSRSQAGRANRTPAIGADDWVDAALATMTELKVRRLPVVDRGQLVGVVNQGDLASAIEHPETWGLLCK